jgi:site-specific recombinase XerD
MPLEQLQKFLGHAKLETMQIYAESTPEMIKASYQKALGEGRVLMHIGIRGPRT